MVYFGPKKGFPGDASGKESTCQCRRHRRCRFNPWVGKIPWRRKWQPTPVFFPGKSHGQRKLAGHSPWSWTWLRDWAARAWEGSDSWQNVKQIVNRSCGILKVVNRSCGILKVACFPKLYLRILFLAPLDLHGYAWTFSTWCGWRLLSHSSARASHCSGFSCYITQAPECGLSGCGTWVRLPYRMWILPRPGIKPKSLALAGRL